MLKKDEHGQNHQLSLLQKPSTRPHPPRAPFSSPSSRSCLLPLGECCVDVRLLAVARSTFPNKFTRKSNYWNFSHVTCPVCMIFRLGNPSHWSLYLSTVQDKLFQSRQVLYTIATRFRTAAGNMSNSCCSHLQAASCILPVLDALLPPCQSSQAGQNIVREISVRVRILGCQIKIFMASPLWFPLPCRQRPRRIRRCCV